jgi:hypothetical protein
MESAAEKIQGEREGGGEGDLPTTGPATRAGRLLQLGKDFCTKQAVAEAQLQVEMSAAMAVEIFAERCTDAQRIGAIGRELGR